MLPSGPRAIPVGWLLVVGMANSEIWPLIVMRPIWLALFSVNQSAPSGPEVISNAPLFALGIANSVMVPWTGLSLPILFDPGSVNQRLPSGPDTMRAGWLPG